MEEKEVGPRGLSGKDGLLDMRSDAKAPLKEFLMAVLLCLLQVPAAASEPVAVDRETLYQTALLQSLMLGEYDGSVPIADLKRLGDMGIGTFDRLNGELIMLDGHVYQALSDGTIAEPPDTLTVPFSCVTFFETDYTQELKDVAGINGLKAELDKVVREHGANHFYMVRIDGLFRMVHVRSEYAQEKPYRPLDKVMEHDQTFFVHKDIEGTVVALYCPEYMKGLNAPGWHFHFIDRNRRFGGHLLDVRVDRAVAGFDQTNGFSMSLPVSDSFQKLPLTKDLDKAIRKVESND